MLTLLVLIIFAASTCSLLTSTSTTTTTKTSYELEIIDLLGLTNHPQRLEIQQKPQNSASKFLREVYETLNEDDGVVRRYRRDAIEQNFITKLDRQEIEKYNNIVSFSSKIPIRYLINSTASAQKITPVSAMSLAFNTNDVPRDLKLGYAALRIYQQPKASNLNQTHNVTITIYRENYRRKTLKPDFIMVTALNSSTNYLGWLEFNITNMLSNWLQYRTLEQAIYGQELLIGVSDAQEPTYEIDAELILISTQRGEHLDKQPFIIGYFNGPELMVKMQTLRYKREVLKRKQRKTNYYAAPMSIASMDIYKTPKTCERLNFTLDFKDLHMHNWVIAPKKFEAYFCGGECNFPLGARMNATNHAIVQTLMHLKQPNLPKPCCVPTVLGSISILHYLNEDSVNLSKYPQSVAKECGCH